MKKKQQENFNNLPVNPEDIIEYCQENFINILPNTLPKQTLSQKQHQKPKHQTIAHQKQETKIIIRQLSILLQLTIQNCVLTCDPKIKYQSNRILGTFQNLCSRDLDDFQNIANTRNRIKLPFYEVDCRDFMHKDIIIKIPPQVSLYQDPLLYYKYSKFAQQELFCNLSIMKTREQRIQIIKNHIPFLDPIFIPIIGQRLQTKAKFSELEDRLLLILLTLHQKKDIGQYKQIYFPNRQQCQIRNRAKNLCAKQLTNPIKKLKQSQYLPLNEDQLRILTKAFMQYHTRWPVISKYYSLRSPNMLQSEYEGCSKLQRLRKSYNIVPNYQKSIRDLLTEQGKKQSYENEPKQKQNPQIDGIELEGQQCKDSEPYEEIYKIIGHLTFLYQEI